MLHAEYLLNTHHVDEAYNLLLDYSGVWSSTLEYNILLARCFEFKGLWQNALEIYLVSVNRFPHNPSLYASLLVSTIEAQSHEHTIPYLKNAIAQHGHSPLFFSHFCRISMLRHRSADARKYSLKDRVVKLTKDPSHVPFTTNYW